MRSRIIRIALQKNPLHLIIPLSVLYIVLPIIGYSTFHQSDIDKSMRTIISAAQTLLPLSCLLLPMTHFSIWFNPLGKEALVSCSSNHRSCIGEIVCVCICIAAALFLAFLLFSIFYGFLWLELIRLYAQCLFSVASYYLCTVLSGNVTLGALPIAVYLLFCICLNDLPDYSVFFVLDLQNLAEYAQLGKYLSIYCISLFLIAGGAILEGKRLK